MSQNQNVAPVATATAAGVANELSATILQAVKSAGTEQFVNDLKKIDEVIANAHIQYHMPSPKETAIHAAIIGGVVTGISVLGFVAMRLIAGSGSSSSAS